MRGPICLLCLALWAGGAPAAEPLESWGPIGQTPTLLAPGFINTGLLTRDVALSPDGTELFFCQATSGYAQACILVTRFDGTDWSPPAVAPFSGLVGVADLEPAFSPDGQRLFFYSTRPASPGSEGDQDLWVVRRTPMGWSEPENLGPPVNTAAPEFFPGVTRDGTLYFCRSDPQTRRHAIWRSRLVEGRYREPELLPETVNSGLSMFNAWVSADESLLIVPVAGHPRNRGGVDYWLCRRDAQDTWSGPFNLGPLVNDGSGGSWSPAVSPDGRYFFFMSGRKAGPEADWPVSWSALQERHRRPGNGRSGIWVMRADFLGTLPREEGSWPEPTFPVAERAAPIQAPVWSPPADRWFGQAPPGRTPRLFAPGFISTGLLERDLVLSPDGRTLVYGLMDLGLVTSLVSTWTDQGWSRPQTAPWHGDRDFACFEPTFSQDGQTVLFLANRAAPGQQQGRGWTNQNIFRSHHLGDGRWSEPEALPPPVTTAAAEYYPSLAADGTLYFSREDSTGHPAIWRAAALGEDYAEPVRLPEQVNCGANNYNAFVARDRSLIILCVAGHPQNLGPADYWVSFRSPDGAWQEARNLGPDFNGPGRRASSAWLDEEQGILFFSSKRTLQDASHAGDRLTRADLHAQHTQPGFGSSDIWWVDASVLEDLR